MLFPGAAVMLNGVSLCFNQYICTKLLEVKETMCNIVITEFHSVITFLCVVALLYIKAL